MRMSPGATLMITKDAKETISSTSSICSSRLKRNLAICVLLQCMSSGTGPRVSRAHTRMLDHLTA